jgi:hypothetical protein
MARTITIRVPDIDDHQYADLAHGAWMLVKLAGLADHKDTEVEAEESMSGQLTDRWQSYGTEAPWH